jgi:hypothetical protein
MNVKYPITCLLFFFTALAAEGAAAYGQETQGIVLAHIKSVGPKQALADYFAKAEWSMIKNGIASGSSDWLKVYALLESVADGEAGEDLSEAIFEAIPAKPFKVLPVLASNEHYTAEQLCTFTFEVKIPEGGINTYLNRLDAALDKARTQKDRVLADACRRGIKTTRTTFMSSPNY